MIKKLTPFILALVFLGQACTSLVVGAVIIHPQKDIKIVACESHSAGTSFDFTCEDELDEDDFHDIQVFQIIKIQKGNIQGLVANPEVFSRVLKIHSRINSAVRSFTCVFII